MLPCVDGYRVYATQLMYNLRFYLHACTSRLALYTLLRAALLFLQSIYIFRVVNFQSLGELDIIEALLLVRVGSHEKTIDLSNSRRSAIKLLWRVRSLLPTSLSVMRSPYSFNQPRSPAGSPTLSSSSSCPDVLALLRGTSIKPSSSSSKQAKASNISCSVSNSSSF